MSKKPVQLQVNNSGAWKTIARFDADDTAACDKATDGAELIQQADPAITFRIATVEPLPAVLMYLEKGTWRKT